MGQTLHKNYGLSVIGLESSAGHSEGAERRAAEQGGHNERTVGPLCKGHPKNQVRVVLKEGWFLVRGSFTWRYDGVARIACWESTRLLIKRL